MDQTPTKFKWDAHKIVMIVRLSMESLFFLLFVAGSLFVSWLERIPNLFNLQLGIVCAWTFSIFFLVWVIKRERRRQSIQDITYYESIGDAFLIIWLTFVFGGPNGPLFFVYFLMIMEAAFTLNTRVILAVALSAVAALVVDFVIGVIRHTLELNAAFLFLFAFRLVAVSLISYYGYSLVKSILKEQKTATDLNVAGLHIQKLFEVKTEFLHIVSHQLRTPLTALRGLLSMWSEGAFDSYPADEKQKIKQRISISCERLNNITNDMLDTLDLEEGYAKFILEPLDVVKIIDEIIEFLKPNYDKKGLFLEFKKPEKPLPQVLGDKQYLPQALQNLIDNAEKYTLKGGLTITLSQSDPDHIQISFRDTGIGVIPEEKEHLFKDKFFRGKTADRVNTAGSGLGLYIVKNIIDGHHGTIEVKSAGPDQGTEFVVGLPVVKV